jgi:hypothetical protein
MWGGAYEDVRFNEALALACEASGEQSQVSSFARASEEHVLSPIARVAGAVESHAAGVVGGAYEHVEFDEASAFACEASGEQFAWASGEHMLSQVTRVAGAVESCAAGAVGGVYEHVEFN